MTSTIGGPRWNPAFDAAAASIGHSERLRPTANDGRGAQVANSDTRPDSDDEDGGRRRNTSEAPTYGGAPDPSGNTGRRLDAFA